MDDKPARLLSLTENLERADLTPIDEAIAFSDYLDWDAQRSFEGTEFQNKVFQSALGKLADSIPVTKAVIQSRLLLLHLPPKAQTMVEQGELFVRNGEIISSLRKLWKSRTNGFTEDQKREKRDSIKAAIHEKMKLFWPF